VIAILGKDKVGGHLTQSLTGETLWKRKEGGRRKKEEKKNKLVG